MQLRRFVAPEMGEALRQVREALGPDAVILTNRRVPEGIEVVAAMDFDDDWVLTRARAEDREDRGAWGGDSVAVASPGSPAPSVAAPGPGGAGGPSPDGDRSRPGAGGRVPGSGRSSTTPWPRASSSLPSDPGRTPGRMRERNPRSRPGGRRTGGFGGRRHPIRMPEAGVPSSLPAPCATPWGRRGAGGAHRGSAPVSAPGRRAVSPPQGRGTRGGTPPLARA